MCEVAGSIRKRFDLLACKLDAAVLSAAAAVELIKFRVAVNVKLVSFVSGTDELLAAAILVNHQFGNFPGDR